MTHRDSTLSHADSRANSGGWQFAFASAFFLFVLSLGVLGFVLGAITVGTAGDRPASLLRAAAGLVPLPGDDSVDDTLADPPPQPPVVEDPGLRTAIESELGPEIDHFGVVVHRLGDGRGAAVNPGLVFYAASTFKLAVLYEAERRRSTGELDFDSRITINEADAAEDLGTFGDLPFAPDGTLTVHQAIEAMITISDNASAVALAHLLGSNAIDETMASLGLTQTFVSTTELPTTAADMALLMEAIVRGVGVDAAARDDMRDLLLRQHARSGIPAGLPEGVLVGNKTGTWAGATHDIAFVEAPSGAYIIAILSDHDWDWDPVTRVSAAVYRALEPQ